MHRARGCRRCYPFGNTPEGGCLGTVPTYAARCYINRKGVGLDGSGCAGCPSWTRGSGWPRRSRGTLRPHCPRSPADPGCSGNPRRSCCSGDSRSSGCPPGSCGACGPDWSGGARDPGWPYGAWDARRAGYPLWPRCAGWSRRSWRAGRRPAACAGPATAPYSPKTAIRHLAHLSLQHSMCR